MVNRSAKGPTDIPTDSDLAHWLANDDATTRPARTKRLHFLLREFGPERSLWFFGGEISNHLFEEARTAYLNGQYIGALLLTNAFVSVTLAGFYRLEGNDSQPEAAFGELLIAARADGYITANEFALFNKVRKRRNFYVHPPALSRPGSLLHRVVDEKAGLSTLAERDARTALLAILRFLKRHPFTL